MWLFFLFLPCFGSIKEKKLCQMKSSKLSNAVSYWFSSFSYGLDWMGWEEILGISPKSNIFGKFCWFSPIFALFWSNKAENLCQIKYSKLSNAVFYCFLSFNYVFKVNGVCEIEIFLKKSIFSLNLSDFTSFWVAPCQKLKFFKKNILFSLFTINGV